MSKTTLTELIILHYQPQQSNILYIVRAYFTWLCPELLPVAALFTSNLKGHIRQNRVFSPNLIHSSLEILIRGQWEELQVQTVLCSTVSFAKKSSMQQI